MKRIILFSICAMAMMLCHAQTTVRVKKAGTLETVLSASQQDTCRHLIVKGKLNSADLQVLRRMAGWADGAGRTGQFPGCPLSSHALWFVHGTASWPLHRWKRE